MSEIINEAPKIFKLQKTVPGNVLFTLHPVSNPALAKEIYLTNRQPSVMLPADWALGVFASDGLYTMYQKGGFTFDNNKALAKLAYDQSLFFSEDLDFTPIDSNNVEIIKNILKAGNRKGIEDAIEKYSQERVKEVAISCVKELSMGVVNMLEGIFHVQLVVDGEAAD